MMARKSCTNHPLAIAGWRCLDCAQVLCPDCVAQEPLENGASFLACSSCDGRVERLMEAGGQGTVRDQVWQVLQVPVSWFTGGAGAADARPLAGRRLQRADLDPALWGLAAIGALWMPLLTAYLAGGQGFAGALLAVRGPEPGFELRPDQLRPVLPDAVPRGTRKARPPPPPPKVIQPIDLDVAPPDGPLVVERGMGGGGGWDPDGGQGR